MGREAWVVMLIIVMLMMLIFYLVMYSVNLKEKNLMLEEECSALRSQILNR